MDDLVHWLEDNGFLRSTTVREAGEYAVRGGILDLFAAGAEAPVRLDFFGETLESIRNFDPDSQRTIAPRKRIDLVPVNEMVLSPEAIAASARATSTLFGIADRDDLLYPAVSEGRRYRRHGALAAAFSRRRWRRSSTTSAASPVMLDHLVEEAVGERLDLIADHYAGAAPALEAGQGASGVPYRPVPPDRLYLSRVRMERAARRRTAARRVSPFAQPEAAGGHRHRRRGGRNFAPSGPPATSTSSTP